MKIVKICDWLISLSFSLLFFLVPLILIPWNYELFEYNKMMLVYGLTIIITGSWLMKMVVHKRLLCQRTPLDIPILLFLISQILSTIFSMDRHVSLFGYYSRFNGGLFSVISYLLLYYALVSNINKDQILRFLKLSLLSALVVSLYGIMEHFGIDKNLWVQDVQNRVFSTLGQPNWLGAYLAIIIPISIGILTMDNRKWKIGVEDGKSKIVRKNPSSNFNPQPLSSMLHHLSSKTILFFYFSLLTFYLCLLYTKSRSGLMGLGIAYIIFWLGLFWLNRQNLKIILKPFIMLSALYFILSAFVGTPLTPSIPQIINHKSEIVAPATGPALETGGTESGEIRKFVWIAAWDVAKHYPVFGSGVETFAFSFYQFKPVGHNLTSEWDFLYNKAHNEYLNYAATTGFVGLGAYLLFIGWFLVWSLKNVLRHSRESGNPGPGSPIGSGMTIALLASFISILITNFFGFSVVIISVYFWLIPAMAVILSGSEGSLGLSKLAFARDSSPSAQNDKNTGFSFSQFLALSVILLFTFYFLLSLVRFWYADVRFNAGYQLSRASYYQRAYAPFHEAIDINPGEPFYHDELSFTDAMLSVAAFQQKEATLSSQLAQEALSQNQAALTVSPLNVNFYKTQTKVYYTLSSLDPNSSAFDQKALESLQMAKSLAPADPKIAYNIALLYGRLGKSKEAIKTLEETVALKPNYQDARYALALFYHEAGKKQEAISQLEYILKYISPNDTTIQNKLKEWQP